jgi:hypothetical protein
VGRFDRWSERLPARQIARAGGLKAVRAPIAASGRIAVAGRVSTRATPRDNKGNSTLSAENESAFFGELATSFFH